MPHLMLRTAWQTIVFFGCCAAAAASPPPQGVWDDAALMQQPALLENLLYRALDGGDARLLASLADTYRRTASPDPVLLLRADAVQLRLNKRLDEAERAYRRLPAAYPDAVRDRLDLAAVLFENGKIREADAEFAAVSAQSGLPAAVRDNINVFRRAIDRQKQWRFAATFRPVYDHNVNQAPPPHCIKDAYCTRTRAQRAYGAAYALGAEKRLPLRGKHSMLLRLHQGGTFYFGHKNYNEAAARADLGWQYRDARREWAWLPFYQAHLAGNASFDAPRPQRTLPYAYRHDAGMAVHWHERLTPSSSARLTVERRFSRYREAAHARRLNGTQDAATLVLGKHFGTHTAVFGSYRAVRFQPARKRIGTAQNNAAFVFHGIGAGWTQSWRNGLHTQLSLDYGVRRYRGIAAFDTQPQRNREYAFGAGIAHRKLQWRGWQPMLHYRYSRTRSPQPWAERRRHDAGIGVAADF